MQVRGFGLRALGIVVLLGLVALPEIGSPRAAEAQFTNSETRCRRALHAGAQRLYRTTLAKQTTCHRQRMVGKLSPLRDCTNPDTLPNTLILDVIENHLLRRARNACEGTPQALGYERCDAPCDDIPIVTFTDVGRCLACQAKQEARTTTENLFGTPPVPGRNTATVRCQTAIGAENVHYATSLMTSHRRCQFLQDRGAIPTTVDCRREDFFNIFIRARDVLERRIGRLCEFEQTTSLDGCKEQTDAFECILRQARTSTDILYRQVYQGEQLSGAKFVFVTSQAYTADEIGGLAGADAICQAAADGSEFGFNGTFRAWLSDGVASPATRFTRDQQAYLLPNGRQVAMSYEMLTTEHPEVAIDVDENDNAVIFQRPIWTGTAMNGEPDPSLLSCNGWTSDDGLGVVGVPYFIGGGLWSSAGALRCNQQAHLYCFQQ